MKKRIMNLVHNPKAWFWYFLGYSVIGWIYEVLVYFIEFQEGFVNRGFLYGPWIPVYGFGAVAVLLLLSGLKERKIMLWKLNLAPLVIFLGIIVITTVVEWITSYLLEFTTGGWLWDYTIYSIQFEGRIALSTSIRFGIIGILGLYIQQPMMERLVCRAEQNKRFFTGATLVVLTVFLVDVVLSCISRF